MVDCADRDRIDEARQELHRIINDREMRDAIILIFANKQDLPEGKIEESVESLSRSSKEAMESPPVPTSALPHVYNLLCFN